MSDAVNTLTSELIAALILIIPVAAGVLYTYLKTQENKQAISDTPTYDELHQAINDKVDQVLTQNGVRNGTNQTSTQSSRAANGQPARDQSVQP